MIHRILVIGSGGREHALAWRLRQGKGVEQVFVAPGNAGTDLEPGISNVAITATDISGLLKFAQDAQIDLTVVGPEQPLSLGIVDQFRAAGQTIFGPSKAAAELESSKAFAKEFLVRHGIPTAAFASFTQVEPALAYLRKHGAPIVVKADGLAAGKGVVVAQTFAEAESAVVDMLSGNTLGTAGSRVVIEEFLQGEEASYIVIANGTDYLALPTSQDHKRVGDGDTGPNTGGMGAYSPAPVVTADIEAVIRIQIIEPTLRGMVAEGRPFSGFLYAGVMISADGKPKVLEFNTRLGDPETQPLMLRVRGHLAKVLDYAARGQLHSVELDIDPRPALGVVLAASGYPGKPTHGDTIQGLDLLVDPACKIFHAGTRLSGDKVLTDGGRVLCATALGESLQQAKDAAYAVAAKITWPGRFFRGDIGWRALKN
jgi:phosphoribosylamine---glycine ligase